MHKKAVKIFIICFLFVSCGVFSLENDAFAAKKKFNIDKVSFKTVTPILTGSTTTGVSGATFNSRKWGIIETTYEAKAEWSDNVTFKYFAMLKDGSRDIMLADEIEYMNIPKDKRLKSYLYLHPTAMVRYGKLERIRVELWHEGVMVDTNYWPNKGKANWWLKIKGIRGNLRNKYYTPFATSASNECQIKIKD